MKKNKAVNVVLIFIFLQLMLSAQTFDYPIKKINGVEYYIYTVEVQEGIYSISKKFGVKQTEIIELNPGVEDGLKAGQLLIVPKRDNSTKIIVSNTVTTAKVDFIAHKVLKKQTLFSISKIYNIPIDSIKKYNPQIENDGLKEGEKLKIPQEIVNTINKASVKKKSGNIFSIFKRKSTVQESNSPSNDKNDTNYIIHKVKPKETLYSISKLYLVEIKDIIKLNPETEITLKTNSEIRIPKKSTFGNDSYENNSNTEISNQQSDLSDKQINNHRTFKIAFLLPLMLEQSKVDANNEKFVDFYAGSLLAINDAKKRGISFEIYTFDTEKSEIKMGEILNNPDLKKADLIIGPAYSNQVAMIGDFARTNKINTLIPFTSKIYDIDMNPYLLQFNPGMTYELKYMIDLLKSKFKKSKIIFAELPDINASDDGFTFVSSLKDELTRQNRNYSVVEITNAESVDFVNNLNNNENNLIIFNTVKYAGINQFLAGMKGISETTQVTCFSQIGWPDIANNSKLKSFFISPFRVSSNENEIVKYKDNFVNNFNWTCSSSVPGYDMLGYDLTRYFIYLYEKQGVDYISGRNILPNGEGIQSEFKFERLTKKSGFINTQLYITEK